MMQNEILQAENAQLRNKLQALLSEKESYLRALACLVDESGGRVAIPKEDLDAVPHKFHVHFELTMAKEPEQPDDTAKPTMVVIVKKKSDVTPNGNAPKLIVPTLRLAD